MDANLAVNFIGERDEKSLLSRAKEFSDGLRSTDLDTSENPLGNCSHFSIRGYVNKVRRSDKKTCWPFCSLLDQNISEKHEISLPPMTVAEFKWWNCQNCLCKGNSVDNVIGDEAVTEYASNEAQNKMASGNLLSDRVKIKRNSNGNLFRAPLTNAKRLLTANQVASGEHFLKGSFDVHHSCTANVGHWRNSSLGSVAEGNGIAGRIQKGTCSHGHGYDAPRENTQLTGLPSDYAKNEKSSERRHKRSSKCVNVVHGPKATGSQEISAKSLEVICGSEVIGTLSGLSSPLTADTKEATIYNKNVSALPIRASPIHDMADFQVGDEMGTAMIATDVASDMNAVGHMQSDFLKMKETDTTKKGHCLLRTNGCNQDFFTKTLKGNGTRIEDKEVDSSNIDGKKCEGSKMNESLIENKDPPSLSQSDRSNKNLQHKKNQKMRMLNDIIKSEVSIINKNVAAFHRHGEKMLKDYSNAKPDELKEENMPLKQRLISVTKEKERKISKKKRGRDLAEMEDERSSLIQWLPRIPNKVKTVKVGAGSSNVDPTHTHSKWPGISATEKLLNFEIMGCEYAQNSNSSISGGKEQCKLFQTEVHKEHLTPEKQHTCVNHHPIVEDGHKDFNSKNINFDSARDAPANRNLHSRIIVDDRPHKKATIISNQIDEKAQKKANISHNHSKDDKYLPIDKAKGVLCVFTDDKANGSVESEQVSDRQSMQGTKQTSDPTVDGIPIEILKLLQDNWRKRHLFNSENYVPNVGKASKFAKNIKDAKPLNVTDNAGYGASSRSYEKSLAQCSQSKTANIRMQIPSVASVSQNHSNNMEDDTVTRGTTSKNCYGKYRPQTNTNGNYCPQHHVLPVGNVDTSERHWSIPAKDSCRSYPFCESSMLAAAPFEMKQKTRTMLPDLNQTDMPSQCAVPTGKSTKVTQVTCDSQEANLLINQLRKREMNYSRHMEQTVQGDIFPSSNATNEYSTRVMQPLDLHVNDTIPAMHLLRLMDPAVCSCASLCSSIEKGRHENIKNVNDHRSYQQDEAVSREIRVEGNEASKIRIGHLRFAPKYNKKDISELRFPSRDVFSGCLFPNGSTYYSKTSTGPFSLNSREYNEGQSFLLKAHSNKKQKIDHLASHTRMNAKGSASKDKNSEGFFPTLGYVSHSQLFQRAQQMARPDSHMVDVVRVRPSNNSCQPLSCVINRNPADFTVVDENNEYMINYADLGTQYSWPERMQSLLYSDQQKQPKTVNLTSLKGLRRT